MRACLPFVALGLREFADQICGDYLPPLVWDLIGHEHADWTSREGLGLVAGLTALNICSDVSGNAWPPVILVSSIGLGVLPWQNRDAQLQYCIRGQHPVGHRCTLKTQNVTRSSSLAHSSLHRDVGLSSSSLRALTTVFSRFLHLHTLLTKSCSGWIAGHQQGFVQLGCGTSQGLKE